jgi:four helix bundle protein
MLPHEKLQVYSKGLAFVASVCGHSSGWSKKHAVVDQLDRASESLILNIVDGAKFSSTASKVKALDYAIGSGLECAGCLDIAAVKGLLQTAEVLLEKTGLSEIIKMLIGLRKAWQTPRTNEDAVPYRADQVASPDAPLFHHERLDVYRAALDLMRWLVSLPGGWEPSNRQFRQIDESATSIILNIAEGNGRYSELDHHRFLDMAENSAVKTAAYLDLAVQRTTLSQAECAPAKLLVERIVSMLGRM